MTTASADDAVEEAFEAFLAGRPVPPGQHGLVAFGDAIRASATAPGRPSAALADLLVTGLLTDQSSPSPATARSAGRAARRAPARSRRRRIRMLAPALFAKIASTGLAAKAATVAGVAVVGLSTAGFTGALPTHVQHTFATVVDVATPFTAPDPTAAAAGSGTPSTTPDGTPDAKDAQETPEAPDAQTTAVDGSGGATTGGEAPSTPTPFGQQVSQMAHAGHDGHPGVDGKVVSSLAHARHSAAPDSTEATGGDSGAGTGTGAGDDGSGDTSTGDTSTGDTSAVKVHTGGSGAHGGSAGHGHH